MIAVLQRVTEATVRVQGKVVGAINQGLMVLVGIEANDKQDDADRMVERLLGYRIFADVERKMNLSVQEVSGGVLLVPQFTLVANTSKGMRPSLSSAATPERGRQIFFYLLNQMRATYPNVAAGVFGADMQVGLINDGPVTFILQVGGGQ